MRRKLTRSRYCRDLGKQATTPHATRTKKHTHTPGIEQYCAKRKLPIKATVVHKTEYIILRGKPVFLAIILMMGVHTQIVADCLLSKKPNWKSLTSSVAIGATMPVGLSKNSHITEAFKPSMEL